jgi:hypothetical protein
MNYELRCEGFPTDDDLEEKLLLSGRKFLLAIGPDRPVRLSVKQIDGLVQGRVEVCLPGRRVSAVVRRRDPVAALEAALATVREALFAEREAVDAA